MPCFLRTKGDMDDWFELDLTQRREGARTQRAVADDSLRPSVFAALR